MYKLSKSNCDSVDIFMDLKRHFQKTFWTKWLTIKKLLIGSPAKLFYNVHAISTGLITISYILSKHCTQKQTNRFVNFTKKIKKRLADSHNKPGTTTFEKMCHKHRILKTLKWHSVMSSNGLTCLKLMFPIFMSKGVFLMINYNFTVSK